MVERIAVIGAGVAGLVAGRRLADAGAAVVIFEKSRGLGGRLATRRTEHGSFDHGAPVVHCEKALLTELFAAGACAHWGERGVVGLPGMSGLVRPLAKGRDIRHGIEIAGLTEAGEGITLVDTEGAAHGPFDRVVSTIPAPQARRLTQEASPADAALAAVEIAPVWTLMAAFEEPPDLSDEERPGGAIDLVVRNSAKPGREGETWVVHATPGWTRERLEAGRPEILPALLAEFADVAAGRLPRPVHVAAHRWRYGLAERPLGAPCLIAREGRLLIGGDWALGSRAEHAWLSGQAMADAILD